MERTFGFSALLAGALSLGLVACGTFASVDEPSMVGSAAPPEEAAQPAPRPEPATASPKACIADCSGKCGGDADGCGAECGVCEASRFEATFQRESWGVLHDYPIVGYAPQGVGKKSPLLVYLVGTWDRYDNPAVLSILAAAAARGFVAISADYDTNFLFGCDDLRLKGKHVFDVAQPASVVTKMCARADVDCARGIVTVGHSQGAQMALFARNFDPRVRAVYGLGFTCDAVPSFGLGDSPGVCDPKSTVNNCLLDAQTTIDPDHVRLVNGLEEICYSTSTHHPCGPAAGQGELERASGHACATESMSCLESNGSGWVIVPNEMTLQKNAHHTWFADDKGVLDPAFALPSKAPWSLDTNLRWLKSFTSP